MKKLAALAALAALCAVPALSADPDEGAAKGLFETKCSFCHGTDRPLAATKTAADWEATVKRMQAKNPGHLSDAEAAAVARYLAKIRGK